MLEKSRKTSVLSFGSELLTIDEISSFTGLDELGNEYNYMYEKSTTLTDVSYPFALIQDDILKLSCEDLSLLSFDSDKYLLISEGISLEDLNALTEAFGDLSSDEIKYFKYDQNLTSASSSLGIDLSMFFTEDTWSQAMNIFYEGALAQLEQEKKNSEYRIPQPFEESEDGVTCRWGTLNGV